jgi:hypothetical protein
LLRFWLRIENTSKTTDQELESTVTGPIDWSSVKKEKRRSGKCPNVKVPYFNNGESPAFILNLESDLLRIRINLFIYINSIHADE